MPINNETDDYLRSNIFNNKISAPDNELSRESSPELYHEFQSRRESPPSEVLITVKQVHGTDIAVIDKAHRSKNDDSDYSEFKRAEADAIITNIRGLAIGVRTADCLPILLYDPVNSVAAVIHAGWRGSVAGITSKTINKMKDVFGTEPVNIIAALGPHIGACCYTVGDEVTKKLGKDGAKFLIEAGGVTRLSLSRLNESALVAAGVREDRIDISRHCTFCESNVFFSYRADPTVTGRQVSFIKITQGAGS